MVDKIYKYCHELGIDLNDNVHPFSMEFKNISKLDDPFLTKIFEHLIFKLYLDLKIIEKFNKDDFEYYQKKLRITDISFWGERFEIYW